MRHPVRVVAAGVAVLVLTGCGPGGGEPPQPNQPPPRTTWALRHHVVESKGLRVTGNAVSRYEESTWVSLGPSEASSCSASVAPPGQGGPDLWVGEKVSTRFQGKPAIRNGAGAEGAYLMWQLADGSWVTVDCSDPDDPGPVDVLAGSVQLTKSSVYLPFDLTDLPDGYALSQIMQRRSPDSTSVYVGRAESSHGPAESDLEIVSEADDPISPPTGRAITAGGRPALLDEDPQHPEVCVAVQDQHVCVRITPSDTGPYPDRSAEIPTMLALAGALTYAGDIHDRSTWLPAEDVFG